MKSRVPERMKDQRKYERIRNECSRVVCFSIVVAMHQHMGIGADRQDKVFGAMEKVQQDYAMDGQMVNAEYARTHIMEQVEPYAPCTFHWPTYYKADLNYKQRAELDRLQDVKDDVATVSWCIFAKCIRQHLGYGRQRFERLREASEAILTDLLEVEAEDGKEVMWTYIDRLMKQANEKQAGFSEMTEEEMKQAGERWIRECNIRAGQERLRQAQDKLIKDYKLATALNVLAPQARALQDIEAQVRAENGLRASGMTRLKLQRKAAR